MGLGPSLLGPAPPEGFSCKDDTLQRKIGGKTLLELCEMQRRFIALDRQQAVELKDAKKLVGLEDASAAADVFAIFDPQETGTLDALEVMSAVHLLSRTPFAQRLLSLFQLYDYNGDGHINYSELVMLIQSGVATLCRLGQIALPTLQDMEQVAAALFTITGQDTLTGKVSADRFMDFSRSSATVSNATRLLLSSVRFRQRLRASPGAPLTPRTGSRPATSPLQKRVNGTNSKTASVVKKEDTIKQSPRIVSSAASGRSRKPGGVSKSPKYRKSSVLRIHGMFSALDGEASGFVDADKWRKSGDAKASQAAQGQQVSIVQVLQDFYPFANDHDLSLMLNWASSSTHESPAADKTLSIAHRDEISQYFQTLDRDNAGVMSIAQLSREMSKTISIAEKDIIEMFKDLGSQPTELIGCEDFVNLLLQLIHQDPVLSKGLNSNSRSRGKFQAEQW